MQPVLRNCVTVGVIGGIASTVAVGSAMGAQTTAPADPDIFIATSEIAQVMLSIAAISFAIIAARLYGGEIGKAIYTVSGA